MSALMWLDRLRKYTITCIIQLGKGVIVHPYCIPHFFFLCSMYTYHTIVGSLFGFSPSVESGAMSQNTTYHELEVTDFEQLPVKSKWNGEAASLLGFVTG